MKNEVYREYGKNFIENSILLKEILNLLEIKLMTHFKRKLKSDKKKDAENSSQGWKSIRMDSLYTQYIILDEFRLMDF